MTADTWFQKTCGTIFKVQNMTRRKLRVFHYPIEPGGIRDLLDIPQISESDIRHSLMKGSLYVKLLGGELRVSDSNIDLTQFDDTQKAFLQSVGVVNGLESGGSLVRDIKLSSNNGDFNTGDTILHLDVIVPAGEVSGSLMVVAAVMASVDSGDVLTVDLALNGVTFSSGNQFPSFDANGWDCAQGTCLGSVTGFVVGTNHIAGIGSYLGGAAHLYRGSLLILRI